VRLGWSSVRALACRPDTTMQESYKDYLADWQILEEVVNSQYALY